MDRDQQGKAEALLVGLADQLDADQLAKAAPQVLARVAPADADELLETRLQRQAEAAHRQRSLRFFREEGSIRFTGSLPRLDGELWLAQLDLQAQRQRRTAIEERDPLATSITPEQRKADALIALIRATASPNGKGPSEPGTGGARVLVTLDYDRLQAGAAGAGLVGDQPLSAGELRRLCCDADLIPVVLRGPSQVLDVGRACRLVTPAIRAALVARDGGCVFPGCTAPVSECDAHHVTPWHLGGPTALWNLVLLCPPPPRPGRTRTTHHPPRPMAGPNRPRRPTRVHPTATSLPPPETGPPPTPPSDSGRARSAVRRPSGRTGARLGA